MLKRLPIPPLSATRVVTSIFAWACIVFSHDIDHQLSQQRITDQINRIERNRTSATLLFLRIIRVHHPYSYTFGSEEALPLSYYPIP